MNNFEEMVQGLPKTPLYESFSKYLSTLKPEESEKVLDYIQTHHILGNPMLEELFMREQSMVFQLLCHEEAASAFRSRMDEWMDSLEPRLMETATEFFEGLSEFTREQKHEVMKVFTTGSAMQKEAMDRHAADLAALAKKHQDNLTAAANEERTRVAAALVQALNNKLDPHVEKAFRASADKFRALTILRDVAVVLGAFCIYSGLKAMFF